MRNYPRNSPRAAGRIVALALLADGSCWMSRVDVVVTLAACIEG